MIGGGSVDIIPEFHRTFDQPSVETFLLSISFDYRDLPLPKLANQSRRKPIVDGGVPHDDDEDDFVVYYVV